MLTFLWETLVIVLVTLLIMGVISYISDRLGLDPIVKIIIGTIVLIIAITKFLI